MDSEHGEYPQSFYVHFTDKLSMSILCRLVGLPSHSKYVSFKLLPASSNFKLQAAKGLNIHKVVSFF
jgi:hypothetical protein